MNKMVRKAENKDLDKILILLQEVLELHAKIRPDIFVPGTTKYCREDLEELLKDELKPIYVAVDEKDEVLGYAFCQIKERPAMPFMVQFKYLFIDDLCVDESCRGQHVGSRLFEYVKEEAKKLGCYHVTLNVWEGNDNANAFYEKMGMKTLERQMEFIL